MKKGCQKVANQVGAAISEITGQKGQLPDIQETCQPSSEGEIEITLAEGRNQREVRMDRDRKH